MVYTIEEKERMDRLLAVFGDYVAASADMDVAYTDKSGYLRVIIAPDADAVYFPIRDWDDLLEMFFFDILSDEVHRALAENRELTNQDVDYLGIAQLLWGYVRRLGPDRDEAIQKLKRFITKWMKHEYLP